MFISIVVFITGLMYNRLWIIGAFPKGNIATYAPELTWLIWGLALGLATFAYHQRAEGEMRLLVWIGSRVALTCICID
ncbi:hypothetical protein JCM10914_5521 [Paenibacillus sp. JCM 10914]|nr:hypothetical protein JCM10914_5521 [Paenibacillus sp. JCM 10914]